MAITVLNKGEPETAKDAVWLLRNMALDGNIDQIRYLVDVGTIPAICGVLTPEQVDFLKQSLKCIEVFLRIGQNDAAMSGKPNRNAQIMTACGGLAKLQSLTKCQEEDIQPLQTTISDLLSRYFQNQ
ncbi:importin subunit alpha-5-like [Diadema antillarum]|uniref:importin subunit alpha-5-like n=1 Tax=Diadema antillarum TaxID=105358 RepID=UPI003A84878C